MASVALGLDHSFAEYVRHQASAHEKHEYVGGLILAMTGGALEHGRSTARILAASSAELRSRRCNVYDSNARVRVLATGNAYHPDASVVRGQREQERPSPLWMTDPLVLVEVATPERHADLVADLTRAAGSRLGRSAGRREGQALELLEQRAIANLERASIVQCSKQEAGFAPILGTVTRPAAEVERDGKLPLEHRARRVERM